MLLKNETSLLSLLTMEEDAVNEYNDAVEHLSNLNESMICVSHGTIADAQNDIIFADMTLEKIRRNIKEKLDNFDKQYACYKTSSGYVYKRRRDNHD